MKARELRKRKAQQAAETSIEPRFIHRIALDNLTAHELAMRARVRVSHTRDGAATLVLTVEEVAHA